MKPEFWHQKWADNQIGFHLGEPHPLLEKHWQGITQGDDKPVFVPLCGKSEDLDWLAKYQVGVTGVELSEIAVRAFFSERFYTPLVMKVNGLVSLYQFDEVEIYHADFFDLPRLEFDYVYDRAALIALPREMREQYVEKLKLLLTDSAKVMLITVVYNDEEVQGPPFSVPDTEVFTLFNGFQITKLDEVDSGVKGLAAKESCWLISKS